MKIKLSNRKSLFRTTIKECLNDAEISVKAKNQDFDCLREKAKLIERNTSSTIRCPYY